jgi:hypothetical protein
MNQQKKESPKPIFKEKGVQTFSQPEMKEPAKKEMKRPSGIVDEIRKDLNVGMINSTIFDYQNVLFENEKFCLHKQWRWSELSDPFLRCGRCSQGTQLIYCCSCRMKICVNCELKPLPLLEREHTNNWYHTTGFGDTIFLLTHPQISW